jgi:S1-C subfamily serine protease
MVGLGVMINYEKDHHPKINGVTKGTGAEEAGIKRGDILLKVDGFDASSSQAVSRALIRHRVGDKVEVVVERKGESLTMQVEIKAFGDEN